MTAANPHFAQYVTGSAFLIDLSRRMVHALLSAANGKERTTSHFGADGLIRRGLMEIAQGQEKKITKRLILTDAGQKVAELCKIAGLEAE